MIIWFAIGLIFLAIFLFAAGAGGFISCWDDSDAEGLLWGLFFWWVSFGCGLWAYNLLK